MKYRRMLARDRRSDFDTSICRKLAPIITGKSIGIVAIFDKRD